MRKGLGRERRELLRGRRGLPHDRRELFLGRRVLRDELVRRRHGRQDARAGAGQRRLRLREHLVLDPRLRDQHDRRPGQLPGREVGHDRVREPVQRGRLVAQVADLLRPVLQVVAEAIGLVLELLLQRGLHERRATQEPDREREEDRDDRHDVVPERDHSSSFRSNSHWRNCSNSCETYSRSGGETTTTAATATSAAATRRNASRVRIRGE